jgi:hypothetical protein
VPRPLTGDLLRQTTRTVLGLYLNGESTDGEAMVDNLHIEKLSTGDLRQYSALVTGSLTSRVLANLTKNDAPYEFIQIGVFHVDRDAYWMVQYAQDDSFSCVRLRHPDGDPFRQTAPPEALLQTTQKMLYGHLLGQEEINGIPVNHYRIDPGASNAAALAAEDYYVHERALALKLVGGDVYLAAEGNYLVRFSADYAGKITEFNFNGKARLEFNLTRPTKETVVQLPQVCADSSALGESPVTVGKAKRLEFMPFEGRTAAGLVASAITLTLSGKNTKGQPMSGGVAVRYAEDQVKQRKVAVIEGPRLYEFMSLPRSATAVFKRMSIYQIGGAYYLVAEGQRARDVRCVNVERDQGRKALDWVRPDIQAGWLTNGYVLYGVYIETETVNGIEAEHYRLDAKATNRVVAQGTTPVNRGPDLVRGDAYIARKRVSAADLVNGAAPIAKDSLIPVRLSAEYEGAFETLDLIGHLVIAFDLTMPQSGVEIQLPATCQNASGS